MFSKVHTTTHKLQIASVGHGSYVLSYKTVQKLVVYSLWRTVLYEYLRDNLLSRQPIGHAVFKS